MSLNLRDLARATLSRSVRNWLRSPRASLRWLFNECRGPVPLALRPDWTFRCPRNAAARAFHLQIQDPSQVIEFDDFVRHLRSRSAPVSLLDIGCHFGIFCFATLHYGPRNSCALGVDPSTHAASVFQAVASLNQWSPRARFELTAAGEQDGAMAMIDTGIIGAGYMVLPGDQPSSDLRRVPVHTADSLASHCTRFPNLIKVDVEGFELEVLHGGPEVFGHHGLPLFLELHNRMMRDRGRDPQEVLRQLHDYGYRHFEVAGQPVAAPDLLAPDIVRILARRP